MRSCFPVQLIPILPDEIADMDGGRCPGAVFVKPAIEGIGFDRWWRHKIEQALTAALLFARQHQLLISQLQPNLPVMLFHKGQICPGYRFPPRLAQASEMTDQPLSTGLPFFRLVRQCHRLLQHWICQTPGLFDHRSFKTRLQIWPFQRPNGRQAQCKILGIVVAILLKAAVGDLANDVRPHHQDALGRSKRQIPWMAISIPSEYVHDRFNVDQAFACHPPTFVHIICCLIKLSITHDRSRIVHVSIFQNIRYRQCV